MNKKQQTPIEYFNNNKKLLLRIINTLPESNIPEEDLIQEAYIAIDKYLPRYNSSITKSANTYMWYAIRYSLLRYIEENNYCIKVSSDIYNQYRKENKGEEENNLRKSYRDKYRSLLKGVRRPFEIDACEKIDEIAFLICKDSIGEMANKLDTTKLINKLFKCLQPRTIEILKDRFGFEGRVPMKYREIGQKYRISHSRAQSLVCLACQKMKNYFEKRLKDRINIGDLLND